MLSVLAATTGPCAAGSWLTSRTPLCGTKHGRCSMQLSVSDAWPGHSRDGMGWDSRGSCGTGGAPKPDLASRESTAKGSVGRSCVTPVTVGRAGPGLASPTGGARRRHGAQSGHAAHHGKALPRRLLGSGSVTATSQANGPNPGDGSRRPPGFCSRISTSTDFGSSMPWRRAERQGSAEALNGVRYAYSTRWVLRRCPSPRKPRRHRRSCLKPASRMSQWYHAIQAWSRQWPDPGPNPHKYSAVP